jgi:hypothetical protein
MEKKDVFRERCTRAERAPREKNEVFRERCTRAACAPGEFREKAGTSLRK